MHPEENGAVEDRFAKQNALTYWPHKTVRLPKATFVYESHDHDAVVEDHFAKQSSEWFKGWQDSGQSPKVLGDFKYEGNKHKWNRRL